MAIAQGISKITVYKKQTGLKVPASGSGGQIIRRETSNNVLKKETYANNEIVSHQQSTGKTHGLRSADIALNGVLSAGTYKDILGSVLRADFAAVTPLSATGVTISGAGPAYTVVIATGSLLTAGFKVGDVIRLTVGSLNAANINKNLLITAIASATSMTVRVLNGSNLVAEGPIAGCTLSVIGKKSKPPLTNHTRDYYTVEDWHSDITQSELFTDVMFGSADLSLSATGNATIAFAGPGLNRTNGASQILTTPTAETGSEVLASVNGILIVNGAVIANVTGLSIKIDGKVASIGAVVGSNTAPDVQRGTIEVSGQFTAFYEDGVLPTLFDQATIVNLVTVLTSDSTANSDFISFNIPALRLDSDTKDDGDKAIIKTYSFTAKLNNTGGPALANDKTIISVQDSLA